MENLKIEVGKYYKTRCGYKVQIYAIHAEKAWYRNIHGAYLNRGYWYFAEWYENGRKSINLKDPLDIISEWTEPHPAESWEVDKKILVSSNGIDWFKRHFAKYENGHIFAWLVGATSFTANISPKIWTFAKPAEEE